MASRAAAGARPGARFAQFKLVLLGEIPLMCREIDRDVVVANR